MCGDCSPLLQVVGGHCGCLQALLSVGGEAVLECVEEEQGWSPLALSALLGRTACLRLLLLHGARPTGRSPRTGATPLHAAAALGKTECLGILLRSAKGSDAANVKDSSSRTPLMLAVLKGHTDCVELLLLHDAAVGAEDSSRRTALFYGAFGGSEACVRLLLKEGASVVSRDRLGKTPLHVAAAVGNGAVLSILLRQCADGEGPDRLTDLQGFTPIHWACYGGGCGRLGSWHFVGNSHQGKTKSWARLKTKWRVVPVS